MAYTSDNRLRNLQGFPKGLTLGYVSFFFSKCQPNTSVVSQCGSISVVEV